MGLKCGIVGLPNVGKSTLFNAISSGAAESANYPFCTIEPNIGIVTVPDKRLDVLEGLVNPQRGSAEEKAQNLENLKKAHGRMGWQLLLNEHQMIEKDNQKIGGILIENFIKQQRIENSIVGIGLNINQLAFDLPAANSVGKLTGKQYQLPEMFEELCFFIEQAYLQLRNGQQAQQRQQYLSALYWFQEKHLFSDCRSEIPQMFEGQIIGIDKNGRLVLEVQGKMQYFSFKEIAFVE